MDATLHEAHYSSELECDTLFPMTLYGVMAEAQLFALIESAEAGGPNTHLVVVRSPWLVKVEFDHGFRLLTAMVLLPGLWLVYSRAGLIEE